MTEPTIVCPKCKTQIKLNESLAAPLIEATRKQYEKKIAQKESEVAKREDEVRAHQARLAKERETIDEVIDAKVKDARVSIAAEEQKKARRLLAADIEQKASELSELKEILRDRDTRLAEAKKAQAELIRKERELEDARREMDLAVEKKVQESLSRVRDKAKQEAEEGLRLRVMEKEEQIASMQRQIEELRRKAEQGSQQLQGEVLELALETILRAKFPGDNIEPVPKGEFGGDVIHRVANLTGQLCGTILWESKRTKNWSDAWLPKLRDDQRAARADVALIVTSTLPKGVEAFDFIDGVWVVDVRFAIPVAISLRQYLIEVHAARQTGEGQQTKMELMYRYLTGPRFRHRVEAIVEKFSDMQADLDRERKAMTRLWAKREQQISGVIEATAGMYGDLQGIAGKTLQEIEGLRLPLLDAPSDHVDGGCE
jgi:hypothetical protein